MKNFRNSLLLVSSVLMFNSFANDARTLEPTQIPSITTATGLYVDSETAGMHDVGWDIFDSDSAVPFLPQNP